MDTYLKLNRAGRKRIVGNGKASTNDWINMVISLKDDIDCSFILLSENPALLLNGFDSDAPVMLATKKRKFYRRAVKFDKSYRGT
jgi:hypothetical protein